MIWAKVKFDFEGVHWYEAAEGEEEFLANPHRHVFKCEVMIEQFHDDRDIEYIAFKRLLVAKFGAFRKGKFSCEMVAQEIKGYVIATYPGRKVKVEVTEDGENGAVVE